jgi:hypothetical protein
MVEIQQMAVINSYIIIIIKLPISPGFERANFHGRLPDLTSSALSWITKKCDFFAEQDFWLLIHDLKFIKNL